MGELLSVGLDVGTTTTQMILSRLQLRNRSSGFAVPEMEITDRQVIYRSPVMFTPLLDAQRVDSDAIAELLRQQYRQAGITPEDVDTGAVIITGETSRKENAAAVLQALSRQAGDFVVATAGPHLESVLAAKGAGATEYSRSTGKTVLHMDIGGGTANLAWIRDGEICRTGCMNIGGRLLKLTEQGRITYRSPVLEGLTHCQVGDTVSLIQLEDLAQALVSALEMAAGLRPPGPLLVQLWTDEAGAVWDDLTPADVLSFSGGVADCIRQEVPPFAYGDMGPALGQAIGRSLLCQGPYRLGQETIRATVIGAGCHSTQLSGSTVFWQNAVFPLQNLPVVQVDSQWDAAAIRDHALQQEAAAVVLVLPEIQPLPYHRIKQLAAVLAQTGLSPLVVAAQPDMAKALGQALSLILPPGAAIVCLDRVRLTQVDYLDIGAPAGPCLPVVIKTLILANHPTAGGGLPDAERRML